MSTTTQPTLEGDRSAEAAESETMENNQSPEGSSPTSSAANSVEESERPVRHQLKKTSITTDAEVGATADATKNRSSKETSSVAQADVEKVAPAVERSQERPKKKRSFDEVASDAIEGESTTTSSKHVRKRSRSEDSDSAPDEEDAEAAPADEAEAEDDDDNEDAEESVIPPPEKGNTQSEDEHAPSDAENGPTPASPPAETLPAESSEEVPTLEEPTTPPPQPSLPSSAAPLKSPPNKRSRDQFVTEQETERLSKKSTLSSAPGTVDAPVLAPATEPASTIPEPEKVPREEPVVGETKPETSEPLKVPTTSGFANKSASSPFGALSGPKSPPPPPQQTSTKAFASSGFASFASTSASPFGSAFTAPKATEAQAASETKPSNGFASLSGAKSGFASATAPTFGSAKEPSSTSGFASSSGFGKLSNGFGSAFKSGTGAAPLTSFASGGGSGIIGIGSKPVKAFGASADDDDLEEGEASESEDNAIKAVDDGPKDPRFYEQEVETGEEGEETVYLQRAKLYVNTDKQWKERGVGVFKVNVAYTVNDVKGDDDDEEPLPKKSARFIMRADGSHRIVLNSPITRDIKIQDPAGGIPKGKNAIFLGFLDGAPKLMQLKMKSNVQTEELHATVTMLQEEMSA